MSRRRSQPQRYLEKKIGVFSRFFTPTSIVIECILTSFDIEQLKWWLSYAKDITSQRDFDLLIQRDIDENRAKKDISEYIVSSEQGTRKPVFLPPLIAAVVPVDEKTQIKKYYPRSEFEEDKDDEGKLYHRTWAPYFQLTFYPNDEGGLRLFVDKNDSESKENPLVSDQVEIGITLSRTPGAKLVVIDGQHRLFALRNLAGQEQFSDAVKDLLVPVLIVYAPNSEEGAGPEVPSVHDVFRTLFVDVNDNAHKVSGHFVILLSDNTLGSMICRSFCDQILQDYKPEGLAQIEWNTRNNKESKTISKDFTLTSIGVIDDLLNSVFKESRGWELLRYMLHLEHESFDFGRDEAGNSKPEPKGFPWQGFSYEHKAKLRKRVKKYIVPCLIKIFFDSKQYGAVKKVFDRAYDQVIKKEKNDRSSDYQVAATMVSRYLLENIPYYGLESQDLMNRFSQKFSQLSDGEYSLIVRNNVYQKGMLTAWIEVQRIGRRLNLEPIHTTEGFVALLDESFKSKLFDNDDKHLYLQDSVYDVVRIKPTVACRHQICRLTLALLGKQSVLRKIVTIVKSLDNGLDEKDFEERLRDLGVKSVTRFLGDLKKERIRKLTRTFRADTNLEEGVREELLIQYKKKEDAKKEKINNASVQIPDDFDKLIEDHIKENFDMAQKQLEGITRFYTTGESEIEDVEED